MKNGALINEIESASAKAAKEGLYMFTLEQYRAKAAECGKLVKTSTGSNKKREFQRLEQSFSMLADNEQWLADNYQNTLRTPQQNRSRGAALAEEEKQSFGKSAEARRAK